MAPEKVANQPPKKLTGIKKFTRGWTLCKNLNNLSIINDVLSLTILILQNIETQETIKLCLVKLKMDLH